MPELPEVETIARSLRDGGRSGPPIVGRTVAGGRLLWARTLAEPDPETFLESLPGQVVTGVGRRAKYLVISLSTGALLIHLRMSGDIRVEAGLDEDGYPLPLQLHDRLSLDFLEDGVPGGLRMVFNDTRKFGRVWLVSDPRAALSALGPEPFDLALNGAEFYQRLHQHSRLIKPLLLDQTFLAGLGNIYTDEALHLAEIHPLRVSSSLTPDEAARLLAAIRAVLAEGIRRNGASIDWVYRGGEFQNYFKVYQRAGQPCPRCGAPIERIVVGQRGTHFCPVCQRLTTDF